VRNHTDWLRAYLEYSSHMEAPAHMRFWSGVSAVAGALRRKVWIDQAYFKWYANFYVILVAPPGVVSKSTTSGVAMNLLRAVPGIVFGPDIVTWPSLVSSFAGANKNFEWPPGTWNAMSAMTLESTELGNLLNPQDREMVDLFVTLWDGKQGALRKETKTSGNDLVENPWINMIACTTPAWIAGAFPEYMIGGGFTSRCVFVYADKKAQEVAYPILAVPKDFDLQARLLVEDLTLIARLTGEYKLTPEAIAWGTEWYHRHNAGTHPGLNDDRFGGYLARKQTHIHKLAMVLAAARGDALWIEAEHLAVADRMVSDLEPAMTQVFSRMGRSDMSIYAERLLGKIRQAGELEWSEAFLQVHMWFPSIKDYENVLMGLVRSGQVQMVQQAGRVVLRPIGGPKPPPPSPPPVHPPAA
jgi:hypothetical protein